MMVGCSYDDFWYGDPARLKYYVRSNEIRVERTNQELWTQGLYFYEALASVLGGMFSKKGRRHLSYPSEPHRIAPMSDSEQAEKNRQTVENFRQQLMSFDKRMKRKHETEVKTGGSANN